MRKSIFAGLIAAFIGSTLLWADGINIPFSFPASTCTNQFIRSIAASTGVGTCASIAAGDFPALTGDVTTAGGSLATTLAASARLKSKLISTTYAMTTASGTQAITGYGFQPTTCFGAGNLGSGSLTANTVIFAMADASRSTSVEYLTGSVIAKSTASFLNFSDTTATNNQVATISSYDADGLTLSWTKTGSPTGTAFFDIMCYR